MSSQARFDQLAARHGLGETLTGRVLLVDDEPENLIVLRGYLEAEWEVVEAQSGVEALHHLERTDFDVVLSDHRMPGLTGVALLESLRTSHPDTAGILITAFSDTPLLIHAINRAGVFRHLKKPWEPDDLLAAVAQARAHVRALRSNRKLLELLAERTDALSAAVATLEATQQQLLHMERLSTVGRLTAGITHDLRNVVQAMMLLERQCADDAVPPTLKERLHLGVAGMRNLLAGLQGINQFASGGSVALHLERIEPRVVVHDAAVVAAMDPLAREHPLRVAVASGLPVVRGDRQKLIQVLVNLLRNAREASTDGGAVLLEAHAIDGGVTLAVEDAGPGVAPDVAARIFQPFVTTKGAEGVGLGLFMASRVAQSHGGALRYGPARSSATGARFELWLPPAHEGPRQADEDSA